MLWNNPELIAGIHRVTGYFMTFTFIFCAIDAFISIRRSKSS
jgi:hypothetical protein